MHKQRTLWPSRRRLAPLLAFGAALLVGAAEVRAEAAWERWRAHDPGSRAHVDHRPWDRFLARYWSLGEDGIARLAYARVSAADRAALDGYLAMLSRVPVSRYNRDEQRAYWINLYNALTARVVLDHYPVASIRDIDISPGLFADGPWGAALITVEGVRLSLDDIEHRILRPLWRDPRLHYALNCASLGCPNLPPVAFTAANTETLLEEAARAYVNHPRGARVARGRLFVSSLYRWYAEDFGGERGVIAHLRRYAEGALAIALAGIDGIAGDAYDWSLNDATLPGPQG